MVSKVICYLSSSTLTLWCITCCLICVSVDSDSWSEEGELRAGNGDDAFSKMIKNVWKKTYYTPTKMLSIHFRNIVIQHKYL